jgi:competence protein ComEA
MIRFLLRTGRILALLAVAILTALPLASAAQAAAAPPEQPPAAAPEPAKASPAAELIDINSATLEELITLPGIADVYARKIVASRPYKTKFELVTRRIIPRSTYSKIREMVIAKQK